MRALLLLAMCFCAPVSAGTLVSYDFGKPALSSTAQRDGVRAEARGEFVTYALGAPLPESFSPRAVKSSDDSFAQPASAARSLLDNIAADRAACDRPALPPPVAGLSRSAERARLQHWSSVAEAECRHSLPAGLLDALVLAESRYQQRAVSHAGAAGLAQLMPATAHELGVIDRFDPLANLDGGARYLRQQLDRFGEVDLALAAYNAGPGAVARRWRVPANAETPGYVRTVLGFWSAGLADSLTAARRTAVLLGFTTAN